MSGLCCSQSAVQFLNDHCRTVFFHVQIHSKGQLCPLFLVKINWRVILNGNLETSSVLLVWKE